MEHFELVQLFKATNCVDDHAPHLFLREVLPLLFELNDFLKKVSIRREVHHDAQVLLFFQKGVFVADDARMLDRSENAHFVDSVLPLLLRKRLQRHLFHRVDPVVTQTLHPKDLAKRATACHTEVLAAASCNLPSFS